MVIGVGSRELTVAWVPPATPNGVIVAYNVLVDGVVLSSVSGSVNSTRVSGLQPFSEYSLALQACTGVGCGNSSSTITQTLPDAPSGLAPPILTVLSPSSVSVRWSLPNNTNGLISRIELRRITGPSSFVVEFVDSALLLETTVSNLTPNTNYSFLVVAFNAGGSVTSDITSTQTLEDIPDQISPPMASEIGSTYLAVTWSPPAIPNGDIVLYNLTVDSRVVFSLMDGDLSYNITNLRPFTNYLVSVITCTARGCGSSTPVTFMTTEAPPTGFIEPVLSSVSFNSITLVVQSVVSPNGRVSYVLRIGRVSPPSQVILNSSVPAQVVAQNLLPFTNYTFELEVSNGAGNLVGPIFTFATSPTGKRESHYDRA